jgi:hypothetical protein
MFMSFDSKKISRPKLKIEEMAHKIKPCINYFPKPLMASPVKLKQIF